MTAVLWHIEISHYNEKARWALAYKGVEHERRTPLPGLHGPVAMALTRGRHRRLPILRFEGRTVADSTAIVAALEEAVPDPPLYPEDPAGRARALALEDYFDEELAPAVRRFVWHHTLDDTDAVLDTIIADGGTPLKRRALRALAPVVRPAIKLDYAVSADGATAAAATMHAAMDRIESGVGPEGYLAGPRFSIADLAAASLFTPIICPAGREYAPKRITPGVAALREELEARPGGAWVHEMFARHR